MIRLAVRCRAEDAERVLAELLELAPGGVEEDRGPGWAEFAVYGAPGEVPALPDLEAVAGGGTVEIRSEEIPDDWADRWRDFHRPAVIGDGRLVVRPSWEAGAFPNRVGADAGAESEGGRRGRSQGVHAGAEQPTGVVDVVVDPGQAFGTGGHATTSLCLEYLLELADAGEARGSLADLGTGSGVLAITASKLGWGPVTACDSEPAAVEAARANAAANGAGIEVSRCNLREEAPPARDTVVANLTADLLETVAERLDEVPRALVCSGLLSTQRERVAGAFKRRGLEVGSGRIRGDWMALLLRAG